MGLPTYSYKPEYDRLKKEVEALEGKASKALTDVMFERDKQDRKWGEQNHDALKWIAILGEEFGEVAKAVLENDVAGYREELIQVAAVAIAAVESLDRSVKR